MPSPLLFIVLILVSVLPLKNSFSPTPLKSCSGRARLLGRKVFSNSLLLPQSTSSLCSSKNNDNTTSGSNLGEEILLKVSLSIKGNNDVDDVVHIIQQYLTSFPFSAVLPVQPLTYVPREDGRGVNVTFLRKKTEEKSGKDGGIEFILTADEGEGEDSKEESSNGSALSPHRVNIEAKRISEGQFISKVFSEGMIVKAFVNGLKYGEKEGGRVGRGYDELMSKCSVESIFHKWM